MFKFARLCAPVSVFAFAVCGAAPAGAQAIGAGLQPEYVIVTGERTANDDPASPDSTVTAAKAAAQINTVNTEDMLKYAPSLLVRKRHFGDTQDPVATRTSGVGASARSLIFVDGILVSSPIGNNNTSASPHFGIAAPQDIDRIDILYGPFAAQYAGNAIGAVINITTRMPDHFELYADATGAAQNFRQYATDETLGTWQLAGGVGDRMGAFSWRFSANHLESRGQPLGYATLVRPAAASTAGVPLTGAFDDFNRTNAAIAVIGDTGIEHQVQDTGTLKLAYDFANRWRLSYTASLFHQDDDAMVRTYLRDGAGDPVYAGTGNIDGYNYTIPAGSFSSQVYDTQQTQLAQALSLASATDGDFAWEIVATDYNYLNDKQRVPGGALPAAFGGGPGTLNRLNGTGWITFDAKAAWHGWPGNDLSFGLHRDAETFAQTRSNLADWIAGGIGPVVNAARGRTATNAAWAQDIWSFAPRWKLALGGRYEDWRAYKASNFSAAPALNIAQPEISARTFSPKASMAWQASADWTLTASWGIAYRMPTVTELYQAITTGPTLTSPNPNLRPERASAHEVSAEHVAGNNRIRLSLFDEDISHALLSQSTPLVAGSPTLFSYVQNVDRTRVRGIELVADQYDALVAGLELTGSLTYADGRTLRDSAFAAAVGKLLPQLPRLRANAVATYRPGDTWSVTLGARYSDRSFATIDNSDPNAQTYQGFESYLVADARIRYKLDGNWTIAAGVDNLSDDKSFLFHPFPQRTFVMEIHYAQ